MSASNNIVSGGVATYAVKVAGTAIPDETRIYSINVHQGVNIIPTARIVLLDGDATIGKFEASSSATFEPGKELTIEAGYDATNKQIFKGIITRQSLKIDEHLGASLEVLCRDASIKMSVGRKSATYTKKKDSEILTSIIGNYSDLSNDITATTTQWPEQMQYYCTDWDFILTRAEANGMIVIALDGKVSVVKPDADTTSLLTLTYGDNLLSFDAELDAINQLGSTKASAWSFKDQKLVNGTGSNNYSGAGNLTSKKLSEVVSLSDYELQTAAYLPADDLTNWAKAQMIKSAYAKITGTATCQGTGLLKPGKYLTLAGLGDRFNGDSLISEVYHDIQEGNWTTEVGIGLSPVWFAEEPDLLAPSASGLLPGIKGLCNGTVKKINEDPDSQYRIQLDMPLLDPKGEGIWARLATFYASSGAGAFFIPEVGDEVVVGFMNEDPRFPVVLGSLYSSTTNKPFQSLEPDEKNSKKVIASKQGIYIEFNDEDKVLTISTPGNNQVVFDDKNKKVTVKDQNSNSLEMSDSGITLKSPKDITLQSDQNVSIKGSQGISLEASGGDVQLKGMNVKATADTQLSLEGSATASLKGGAELKLNAAMVMIN
jgi:Rhs element Vgr protein